MKEGKFPENFEEAMQWARLKDRKLQFQAHVMRRESQPSTNVMGEQQPHAPPMFRQRRKQHKEGKQHKDREATAGNWRPNLFHFL